LNSQITVNGRFLTRVPSGVDRFAEEVLRTWLAHAANRRSVSIALPSASRHAPSTTFQADVQRVGRLHGHAWEQLELSRHCGDSMLLNLCNTAPARRRHQLVVLHDAAVVANPGGFTATFRHWYRWLFSSLMARANIVATVSKFSASELMRHIGGRSRHLEIIYESGEHVMRHEPDGTILARLALEHRPYVLAVGNRTPNKNFAGVIRAAQLIADLNVSVVVAGGSNSRVFAEGPAMPDNVILAGRVRDAELRALYENARCFVYPSFYEGFGLPPLEAMHCGCPVIVSNRASLPEICGDAALYCDPSDPATIAAQIRRIVGSASLRAEMKEAGHACAARYSWQRSADQLEQILAAYERRSA
jgi:glycosyltransferase involved in cell wall biosynthesis